MPCQNYTLDVFLYMYCMFIHEDIFTWLKQYTRNWNNIYIVMC